ncbi:hypothetical protein IE81DRAFT_138718 [Ceraceosorus guamensis]|uniref:Mediator complex subunit 11 n=1 Tax=Ceraceosorus guamensis TaxID=1522189 RepID=A0A316VXX1_9BASI|nr:hypothetical protein IE81DRAFT_138718 [Ceraceosorus guamensis]PWN42330.1 hypothetical protein IE81DRAFT_138718 [Ceraceosorus guamensis]
MGRPPCQALADLLMQTAGSLSALVTITSDGEKAVAAGSDNAEHQAQAARDSLPSTASSADRVKVFEGRASQWFATLNDIQTSLRTATATLRADGRPAISDGVNLFGQGSSYAARTEAGSAGRGHTLPLQGAMSGHGPRKEDRDASLSLGALRLQQQSWRQLNDALEEIATGSAHLEPDQHHIARNRSSTSEERTRDVTSSVREHQLTADARLIGALLGSTSTLGSHQNPGEKHQPASGSSSTALA